MGSDEKIAKRLLGEGSYSANPNRLADSDADVTNCAALIIRIARTRLARTAQVADLARH